MIHKDLTYYQLGKEFVLLWKHNLLHICIKFYLLFWQWRLLKLKWESRDMELLKYKMSLMKLDQIIKEIKKLISWQMKLKIRIQLFKCLLSLLRNWELDLLSILIKSAKYCLDSQNIMLVIILESQVQVHWQVLLNVPNKRNLDIFLAFMNLLKLTAKILLMPWKMKLKQSV